MKKQELRKLIKERDIQLKETYKKGQDKLKQMEASIDEIKGQIEGKMSKPLKTQICVKHLHLNLTA